MQARHVEDAAPSEDQHLEAARCHVSPQPVPDNTPVETAAQDTTADAPLPKEEVDIPSNENTTAQDIAADTSLAKDAVDASSTEAATAQDTTEDAPSTEAAAAQGTTEDSPSNEVTAAQDDTTDVVPVPNETEDAASYEISEDDLSQIWAWNGSLPETITQCTHDAISLRARLHPQKLAVESWDGQLTYGDADAYSTRLAHRLRRSGVEIGTLVPLLFEKSLWTVVGVLAIMKAGGTFVLMDPSQPEARLQTIVEEAAAKFILTSRAQEDTGARVAPGAEVFVVPSGDIYGDEDEDAVSTQAASGILTPGASSGSVVSQDAEARDVPSAEQAQAPSPLAGEVVSPPQDTPTQGASSAPAITPQQLPELSTPESSASPLPNSTTSPLPAAVDPIPLPSPPPSISDSCSSSALPNVPPETPMYVIFTSGSTGKPKGVVISHLNYASGAIPRARAVGYASHSRVFDFASYAFDVSIDCMLCTLSAGGTLCVPSDADRVNDLGGAIRSSGANMAHMTPSVARVLDPDVIAGLEVLGLGGEAVSGSDAEVWGRSTRVIIAYGPSECTVGCTVNGDLSVSTNIGYGVGGLTWIVDPEDHDRLVPLGSVGELLIEGPVVGVGYLNNPEKTSEVFINDPAWLLRGHGPTAEGRSGRLYKTGDLVRYDPNGLGSIAFVGRKDQQVKLRGQRVELSEVEHHLRRHLDRFGQIVAEVIYPVGAEPTLVAFVSENKTSRHGLASELTEFSPELEVALAEAEAALEKEVPRYMIPSVFVPLTAIPALVSGKTDRKCLKEIGKSMTREKLASVKRLRRKIVRPETEMEVALHSLWTKVLGTDIEIGLQDSFLALGGDSLRAMRLASIAREAGYALTVSTIFQCPTLKSMASKLEKTDGEAQEPAAPYSMIGDWDPSDAKKAVAELCQVAVEDIEDVYPCTPLQEALMALSAKVTDAYVAQRVVKLDDAEMADRLERAFNVATADSAVLRTRIVQVPEHGLVQVLLSKPIEWHRGSDLAGYLSQDREEPMDLGKPLVRYAIIKDESSGEYQFVLTMHHALYDGWSMPLVVNRINQAYKDSPVPAPPHFREFIRYLETLDRSGGEMYWREKLEGAVGPQFPMLPRPSYQPRAESLHERYVPIERHPDSTATVATILRGAWALVASEYTASRDVVFGETLTGRNAPIAGAELIEGPMITTVPIRLQIDLAESVSGYLDGIQAQTAEQIPHEHIGLQHIRRLSPDALQACELRTGLVLHPTADDVEPGPDAQLPASRLMPAGDEEAAQEALKFNTYALMLVCTLDPKGFLIMASFDSKTVDVSTMEDVLAKLGSVVQQLCLKPGDSLGNIEFLEPTDREGLHALSAGGAGQVQSEFPGASAAWVVDLSDSDRLLPRGALGELVIQSASERTSLERIESPPGWLAANSEQSDSAPTHLYRTGRLATWSSEGTLRLKGLKSQLPSNHVVPKSRTKTAVSVTSSRQKSLRTLWSRVLSMPEDDISLSDSFFQLGGDSISAMKLVSEARNAGWSLTVAKAFQNRSLYDMSKVLEELEEAKTVAQEVPAPFSLVEGLEPDSFISEVRSSLADPTWKVVDILPVRPLQAVAIDGTVRIPRFSARYEIMYFDAPVDRARLYKACQDLISMTEILRTVFVSHRDEYLAVILEDIQVPVVEYKIDQDVEAFTRNLCELDVQTSMPLGSAFVKWFHVQEPSGKSSLIFRISHSQYDEICLPILLKQLSALYERRTVPTSIPFSTYVGHAVRKSIPSSIPYWKDLLQGSTITPFRPDIPVTNAAHFAIEKTFDISARSTDTTIATIPTAIWALTLARRLSLRDVTFGEVVSGRNIDFHHAQSVLGPCWQYVPVRVAFSPSWTASDLLAHVQAQHIATSAHESLGLPEIVKHCTDWEGVDWFDTVVHQDVEHVTELPFIETKCRMETYYPHFEPLRELKMQAFVSGEELTIEIVTVESWKGVAEELLGEIGAVLEEVLYTPEKLLFDA
ncbi:related to AM-toxin synthetase (AMT) [Cephalotrichum gorgonifer]|uniref:Related to AM-toxin synthetase (AMT) n=1 Tax=Cephalotrichum gorgonifer TaxID=2041049 RepID=A0AAE8N676_9PEZI|nr:related to AM-toxin synthetase (AMT) [Cephalotrichum gorgonifer]